MSKADRDEQLLNELEVTKTNKVPKIIKRKVHKVDLFASMNEGPGTRQRRMSLQVSLKTSGLLTKSSTQCSGGNTADQLNKDLSSVGRFMLFFMANSYLSYDFEKCLETCENNYSYVANSNLFEGNILRFKALCLE